MKKPAKQIVSERLDGLMNTVPHLSTQQALAKKSGVGQTTIGRIRRAEVDATAQNLKAIADAFGVTVGYLYGEDSGDLDPGRVAQDLARYEVHSSKFKEVPVIGKGMGGIPDSRTWTDGDFPAGTSNEYAELATSDPNAFLARVEESSMAPRYNPGEYFLVEPNTEPQIGDDVLVRFKNDGTSLKRLVSRQNGFIGLSSYNNTTIITAKEEEVAWIYYVAHPVPVRKIKSRI